MATNIVQRINYYSIKRQLEIQIINNMVNYTQNNTNKKIKIINLQFQQQQQKALEIALQDHNEIQSFIEKFKDNNHCLQPIRSLNYQEISKIKMRN